MTEKTVSIRTAPVMHNHITQVSEPQAGCPACELIRPEVMSASPRFLANGWYGEPRQPSASATEGTTQVQSVNEDRRIWSMAKARYRSAGVSPAWENLDPGERQLWYERVKLEG